MVTDEQKRKWEEEGNSFLLTLLLADQMAYASKLHRAAAIRQCARTIRDQSTDPFFKERIRKIIKLSDKQLLGMMPGLWSVCMNSEHFDVEKEKDLNDLHVYANKRPTLKLSSLAQGS